MGRMAGKTALITGGGSGIGEATALLFAREGAKLYLTDIDAAKAEAVADACQAEGAEAYGGFQDVRDEAAWVATVADVVERFGSLDALVNNAGVGNGGRALMETDLEAFRSVQAINLDGVFMGVRYGGERMVAQGGGSIINISSIYGIVGAPSSASYCASKGGVRLLSKAAAYELAKTGVRVNSVHPGFIDTPLVQRHLEGNNAARDYVVAGHPIGRLGQAKEIAEACLYLASDASSFTTGSELVVDGGWTAR